MYRMYGQTIAPALSALPPSLAVVAADLGSKNAPAFSTFPPSMVITRRSGACTGCTLTVILNRAAMKDPLDLIGRPSLVAIRHSAQ